MILCLVCIRFEHGVCTVFQMSGTCNVIRAKHPISVKYASGRSLLVLILCNFAFDS